eukprot:5269651-Amphidinium_carterae.1
MVAYCRTQAEVRQSGLSEAHPVRGEAGHQQQQQQHHNVLHNAGGKIMPDLLFEGPEVGQVAGLKDGSSTTRDDARMTC